MADTRPRLDELHSVGLRITKGGHEWLIERARRADRSVSAELRRLIETERARESESEAEQTAA